MHTTVKCPECGKAVRIIVPGWPYPDRVIGGHCVGDPSKPGAPPAMLCSGSFEPESDPVEEIDNEKGLAREEREIAEERYAEELQRRHDA